MTFTRSNLTALVDDSSQQCISLFMPMVVSGRERAGNRIRFKNLLQDTKELLIHSCDEEEGQRLLSPLEEIVNNEEADIWQHPSPGLALFRSPERFECYTVRHEMNEEVHVGNRYYLRPMLRLLQGDGRFFLLAASQNVVRLLEGDRETILERKPDSLPASLAAALNVDEWTSTLQYHSHSRGSRDEAMFHGQGAGEDDQKKEPLQFFQRLDEALTPILANHTEPLVFAGVDYLFPIFQKACKYKHLMDTPVSGNADQMTADELQEEAWKVVAPHYRTEMEAALKRFANASATDLATTDLQQIIFAAQTGGVDTLLVSAGESTWGEMDGNGDIQLHPSHQEDSVDLLEEASFLTLKSGGRSG